MCPAVNQENLTWEEWEKALEYLVQNNIPLSREYAEAVEEQAKEEAVSEQCERRDMQKEDKVKCEV